MRIRKYQELVLFTWEEILAKEWDIIYLPNSSQPSSREATEMEAKVEAAICNDGRVSGWFLAFNFQEHKLKSHLPR